MIARFWNKTKGTASDLSIVGLDIIKEFNMTPKTTNNLTILLLLINNRTDSA